MLPSPQGTGVNPGLCRHIRMGGEPPAPTTGRGVRVPHPPRLGGRAVPKPLSAPSSLTAGRGLGETALALTANGRREFLVSDPTPTRHCCFAPGGEGRGVLEGLKPGSPPAHPLESHTQLALGSSVCAPLPPRPRCGRGDRQHHGQRRGSYNCVCEIGAWPGPWGPRASSHLW